MEFYTAKLDERSQRILLNFPLENYKIFREISPIPYASMLPDYWEIPVNKSNIEKLKKLGFSLTEPLLEWDINKFDSVKRIQVPFNKNGLTLYPYQIEGVSFIEQKNGRALIADEMGLGKTVQALSWLQLHPNKRPVLIICPSSLKINWKREAIKWLNYCNPEILYGTKPHPINGDIIIVNYDILFQWLPQLRKFKFEVIIADEAHYIKNFDAKRTVAFNRLSRNKIPHLIALTGTPIENKPIELLSIIQSINPSLFPNYETFIHRFCGGNDNAFGNKRNASGASNTFELNSILKKTIMIRRKKMDVLKDLPTKQIVKVPLEITNKLEYQNAEKQFIRYIHQKYNNELNEELEQELKQFAKRNKIEVEDELSYYDIQMLKNEKLHKISKAPVLAQIETLKQLAVNGKMEEITSWIETFLA